jgi:hypothetical protein
VRLDLQATPTLAVQHYILHTACHIPRASYHVPAPRAYAPYLAPCTSRLVSHISYHAMVYTCRPGKGKVDNSIWIIGWGIKTLQVKYGSPVPPITGESILCIRHAYMYKARPHPIFWGVYIMYMSLQGIFAAPTSLRSGRGVLINPAFHLVVR